ncbi:hypothetical protein [uncultured Bacteroides sp.]
MKQNWKQTVDTIVSTITSITELIMPNACLFRIFLQPHSLRK